MKGRRHGYPIVEPTVFTFPPILCPYKTSLLVVDLIVKKNPSLATHLRKMVTSVIITKVNAVSRQYVMVLASDLV